MDTEDDPIRSTSNTKNLSNAQRQAIFEMLLKQSENGILKRGILLSVANLFSVNRSTIYRIWRQARIDIENGSNVNVSSKIPGKVGRKRVEINLSQVLGVPLRRRTNIRSLSKALEMSKSTIHRRVQEGMINRHSNAIKPYMSDENKKARVQFALSMINPSTLRSMPTFIHMYNYVHIDEKWFYMTKTSETYYLLPNEEDPLRSCSSKRYITKIMFLSAVARPRFDTARNQHFDGKIGIFPFIYEEPAKRSSKNRVVGTLETKPIISVTKDVIRSCLIEKVLPAIRAKWRLGIS